MLLNLRRRPSMSAVKMCAALILRGKRPVSETLERYV
jgi:hypothetical protein